MKMNKSQKNIDEWKKDKCLYKYNELINNTH